MEGWRKRTWLWVMYVFFEWDWSEPGRKLGSAIECSPNSSDVHLGLAGWFVVMGRYDDR